VYGERFETRDEMKVMDFESIEAFYNRTRLHSTLGYPSPKQYLDRISAIWTTGSPASSRKNG